MLVRLLTKPNKNNNNKKVHFLIIVCCVCVFITRLLSLSLSFVVSNTFVFCFLFLSFTVPVRPRRMIRETYTFDTVASNTISNGELTAYRIIKLHRCMKFKVAFFHIYFSFFSFLSDKCAVTCLRGGIEVQKSTVTCEIKSGCKLIQKTGECCPEYQCGMCVK